MNSISQRIKYYRRKKGLTQMDVASVLEIRTDNYTKYESGVRIPKDDRLVRLAQILGVSYNTLNEGVEREFIGLLNRHAISAVLGDTEAFEAFAPDMEASSEAYYVAAEFFNSGIHYFAANNLPIYKKYIERPTLSGLIDLYGIYKEECLRPAELPDDLSDKEPNELLLQLIALKPYVAAKWAFCTAVKIYLDKNDTESILNEAGKVSENLDALQFFVLKVFVPYLSFIIDAVELCVNTTIDDFKKSFLFDALTSPDAEDEECGNGGND
jgi:transcriptional regulator with XRE-family HTH domain